MLTTCLRHITKHPDPFPGGREYEAAACGVGRRERCGSVQELQIQPQEEQEEKAAGCSTGTQSPLTECIYSLVLESQRPHKIVNLLFTITNEDIKLTVLWGS